MAGNDRVRFCEHCKLTVHNVDFITKKQLRRLIARSGDRLCVSYRQPQIARPTAPPILYKIGRRTSVIAASAFSATLSISSAVAARPNLRSAALYNQVTVALPVQDPVSPSGNGSLYGYVFDPNGAALPGASVTLRDSQTLQTHYRVSSGSGEYRFDGLKPGTYQLKVSSQGFDTRDVANIVVRADDNNRVDQTMSIAPIEAEGTVESPERAIVSGGAVLAIPENPLVRAVMEDKLEDVQTVLLSGPNVNARDQSTHYTALERAVMNGNREIMQVLLWAKADVNARDESGETVLMTISESTTSEIVWDLINAGAKLNLHDNDGDTALMNVAEVNNVEALKVLLDAGAKVNETNNEGETALMKAAGEGLVHNVRALILAGANVNARDKEGKTALMYALEDDHSAVVRLLKAHGAIEFEAPEKQ
jgi:hypothetical protein